MKKILFLILVFIFLNPVRVFAGSTYPGDLSIKFKETEVFSLTGPSQISQFFTSDHRQPQTGALPGSVTFSGDSVTLTDKVGLGIDNPLKNEPFYKVEVTINDTNQQNLISYLTLIDKWWSYQYFTNGISVGINTDETKSTYWYWHTQFKNQGEIPDDQLNFSKKALARFSKRVSGDIKLEFYVTPIGTYAVVNGANFSSFPSLYIGSYLFKFTSPLNYIVLSKFNTGGDQVTFKSLKIIKLDSTVSSVDEVNAYFIKKTIESDAFAKLADATTSFNGASGFQNALWVAFLYRGYDYYFKTDHRIQTQQMVDQYLNYLPTFVSDVINSYNTNTCITQYPMGWNEVKCTNHQYINSIQANPFMFYAVSSYLRPDQIAVFKTQMSQLVDVSMQNVKADGSFPDGGLQYIGNNPSDEVNWLTSFYAGYYANFPNDHPRADKLLDYIKFVSFLILTDGKSIRQVYGDKVNFNYLADPYNDFITQYIWPTGETDHHWFHPSLNYGQGYVGILAIVRNYFDKTGLNIQTLSHNLDLVYNKVIKENLNINDFHLNHPNPKYDPNNLNAAPQILEDVYIFNTDGSIKYFEGKTSPSLVEDWGNVYTNYHIIENYGDYATATQFAKNVYYGFYSGAGKLFCDGSKCDAGTANFYNYIFSDSLFAMLFSKRSQFIAPKPSGDLNRDGKVDIFDYNILLQNFGNTTCGNVADIDGNCKVDIFDYNTLVGNYGR